MEENKLLIVISKIIQILNKSYEEIVQLRKSFMNNNKIQEYFFSNTIVKTETLERALITVKDNFLPKVNVETDKTVIDSLFLKLYQKMNEYQIDYQQCIQLSNKYEQLTGRKLDIIKKLNYIPKITPLTINVQKFLEKINADYLPSWSFKLLDEALSISTSNPYCFKMDLKVDFLGYLIRDDKLLFYAILVDTGKATIGDYLKQYFLQQMNIHLIRLNKNHNIRKQIDLFLSEISKTDNYIRKNGLDVTNFRYYTKQLLNQFYDDYQYNHVNYLNCAQSDDSIELLTCCFEPGDTGIEVPTSLTEYFSHKKFIFTK